MNRTTRRERWRDRRAAHVLGRLVADAVRVRREELSHATAAPVADGDGNGPTQPAAVAPASALPRIETETEPGPRSMYLDRTSWTDVRLADEVLSFRNSGVAYSVLRSGTGDYLLKRDTTIGGEPVRITQRLFADADVATSVGRMADQAGALAACRDDYLRQKLEPWRHGADQVATGRHGADRWGPPGPCSRRPAAVGVVITPAAALTPREGRDPR